MPTLTVSRDQQVLQQVELRRERTLLGRHPDNDVVITHPAVSAQHAAFILSGRDCFVEDLGSTNGTFVNGQRIARRLLEDGDLIVVARFQIAFAAEAASAAPLAGSIEVISGANAGKRLTLVKPVSTLGRPSVQVVAITRHQNAFYIHHVEGTTIAQVNGAPLDANRRLLADGDRIDLVGASMLFHLTQS